MIKQKRILILTGAGTVYPWFNNNFKVTTESITEKIRKNDFCDNIYNELQKHYDPIFKEFINFETIINVLERIFLYYRGRQDYFDSDFPALFVPKEIVTKFFPLESDKDDVVVKIYNLFCELIIKITEEIFLYVGSINSPKKVVTSKLLSFLKYVKSKNNIIRSYTTNYDQMFVDIYKNRKPQPPFDGFILNKNDSFWDYDLRRIQDSDSEDCYYNLHGSIFWHWRHSEDQSVEKSRFYKTESCIQDREFHIGSELRKDSIQKSNPGEPYLLSPIITGYNKLQRINQEPFNSFAHAFYHDCHKADIFIFIGFSFNDNHINNILSHVDWSGKKVLMIDFKKNKDFRGIQIFESWCNENIEPDKTDRNRIVNLYNNGFENFLNEYSSVLEKCDIM